MSVKQTLILNRIFLGLVMLVPGLLKLFMMGPEAITGMLSGMALFAWAPGLWAWILILSEIGFGVAILANWKLRYTVWPAIIILAVASFTMHYGNIPSMLVHLGLASNYLVWWARDSEA